jgi:osmotically inducible protein OsmC
MAVANVLYTAEATATGGRNGSVRTSDGNLDLTVAPPEELGGPGGNNVTNPEQLFASGYSACFHNAILAVAQHKELDASDSSVTARVGFGPGDQGPGWEIEVAMSVKLPNLDQERAERLVGSAHKVCPYSIATRDNVKVDFEVEAGAESPTAA